MVTRSSDREKEPTVIAFPFVFALLLTEESKQYEAVLKAISDASASYGIHQCRPQKVVSDFELAIQNASRTQYPEIPLAGCFFHLGQSLYRRIQSEGLQSAYNDSADTTIRQEMHIMSCICPYPRRSCSL